MSKHSPGPWICDDSYPDDEFRYVLSRGFPFGIARLRLPREKPLRQEQEANAGLIASAPDLLEFAQWVLSLKTGGMIEARARAVVAKAEGSA